jgi:hypothetical protein
MLPDNAHIYDALRERNPWLPPGDFISGRPGFTIQFGLERIPTMSIEVFIEIPEFLIGSQVHGFYQHSTPADTPKVSEPRMTEPEVRPEPEESP